VGGVDRPRRARVAAETIADRQLNAKCIRKKRQRYFRAMLMIIKHK